MDWLLVSEVNGMIKWCSYKRVTLPFQKSWLNVQPLYP